MKTYDDYIAAKAEEYNIGCTPKAISHNEDFVADYNCEHCDLTGCVHWSEYNN